MARAEVMRPVFAGLGKYLRQTWDKKILQDATKLYEEKNINARTIFIEGHPSHTIVETAHEEGFDMIVIGSRGLSGLKKVFLGSVSGAVVQEAKDCIVSVVK